MSTATHILHVAHGHSPEADAADYWVEEVQAVHFFQQLQEPKAPFVIFRDEDGIVRAYALADVRFAEVRKVSTDEAEDTLDKPRPEAKVISILDYARNKAGE